MKTSTEWLKHTVPDHSEFNSWIDWIDYSQNRVYWKFIRWASIYIEYIHLELLWLKPNAMNNSRLLPPKFIFKLVRRLAY